MMVRYSKVIAEKVKNDERFKDYSCYDGLHEVGLVRGWCDFEGEVHVVHGWSVKETLLIMSLIIKCECENSCKIKGVEK